MSSELFNILIAILKKEIEKPEWKENVLKPMLYSILPYIFGFISLNFFMTIAAISLVIFISKK
jgi:hypothetical protein